MWEILGIIAITGFLLGDTIPKMGWWKAIGFTTLLIAGLCIFGSSQKWGSLTIIVVILAWWRVPTYVLEVRKDERYAKKADRLKLAIQWGNSDEVIKEIIRSSHPNKIKIANLAAKNLGDEEKKEMKELIKIAEETREENLQEILKKIYPNWKEKELKYVLEKAPGLEAQFLREDAQKNGRLAEGDIIKTKGGKIAEVSETQLPGEPIKAIYHGSFLEVIIKNEDIVEITPKK
jgi:hypothetical protein